MLPDKAHIIDQLKKEILPLQGFKPCGKNLMNDMGLGAINRSFPGSIFPIGAIHEFIASGSEDSAASSGMIAGLMSSFMKSGGAAIWISSARNIFPPALNAFGIDASRLIFIELQKERHLAWAIEEALKCDGLAAVVGEIPSISFTTSRRLQLAVENSRVTGFLLRNNKNGSRSLNNSACIARWQVTSLPCTVEDGLPGVSFPRWRVELLKVRNGKPGSWEIEWRSGRFNIVHQEESLQKDLHRKTG